MQKLGLGLIAVVIAVVSLTSAVAAADLSVRVPPMTVPPFTWTGAYAGVHGGYGWSTSQGLDARGGLGGGQVGFNFQEGNFVVGIEGDISGSDISQTVNGTVLEVPFTLSFKNDALASWRGRAGIAYNNLLFYGTAGGAWGHDKVSVNVGELSLSGNVWHLGWSAGGGVEWAFASNWSGKIEYLHYGLGSAEFFDTLPSGHINIDSVKLGINYLFR